MKRGRREDKEKGRGGDKERGRRTANNGQESVVLARIRIANNNRDNGPTVNNPASDNLENDRPANNQTVSSRDSNQVNVSRGKLKKDSLNRASNRISQDRPVSNLKAVSVSRGNRSPDNAVSKDRSD